MSILEKNTWWKLTPPPMLRHIVPFRVLILIDRFLPVCWAQLVLWKLYGADESWWPRRMCFAAHPDRYDYCGKFKDEEEDRVCGPDVLVTFEDCGVDK